MQNEEIFTVIAIKERHCFYKFQSVEHAYAYYRNKRVDLISGAMSNASIIDLNKRLSSIKVSDRITSPVVIHLFYELGAVYLDEESYIDDDDLLAIEIKYKDCVPYFLKEFPAIPKLHVESSPSRTIYGESFREGYQHLLDGNCYQFNLTFGNQFKYENDLSVDDFLSSLWSKKEECAAFAHATFVPKMDKLYLSNSPECLFQIEDREDGRAIRTMPIKGTVSLNQNDSFDKKWKELSDDIKNESELYMIADLLRNDLNRVATPTAKITKKKAPLLVPGILHQYADISNLLNSETTLYEVVSSLFPGGSITGAPKRRVFQILNELERGVRRGFYCGSTVVLYKNLIAASINIRSSEVDLIKKRVKYHAGGGITLRSNEGEEFQEMELKVASFMNILT